ncbi:MAG: ABC transporter substrate-binding protein [Eubacteriales bacterium]|nr:ABC transporter substrate-binding protein [Eubacteriales bacterium]
MKKKVISAALCVSMLASLTAGQLAFAEEDNVIRVAISAPMTGGLAILGEGSQHAVDMAVEEINALGGYQIEVLNNGNLADDASDSKQAINVYNSLMAEDPDVLIATYNSACSIPMAELAQKDGMVQLSPGSTNYSLTEIGDHIFRTCFIDPYQGKMASKFAVSQGWTTAAIIYAKDDDYSNGLKDAFVESAAGDGVEILYTGECTTKDTDFTAQVSQVVASDAEMLYFPCFLDIVPLLVQQARDAGFEGAIVCGDGSDGADTTGLEDAFNGVYYTNHYSSEDTSEAVQNFVTKFTENYGSESLNACAALYYDSVYMVYQAAINGGGTDTESILAGMTNLEFSGVTGSFTLNDTGDPEKNVVVNTYEDGVCTWMLTLDPEGNVVE